MELASSLKRMGLQEEEDCASVTFGTVQYFHQESISQTGKEMLEQKFGIQAKAVNLDSSNSSTLCNLVSLTNDTTFNSNTFQQVGNLSEHARATGGQFVDADRNDGLS